MMKIKFCFFVLVTFFFLIPIAGFAYLLSGIAKLLDTFVDWANLKIEYSLYTPEEILAVRPYDKSQRQKRKVRERYS